MLHLLARISRHPIPYRADSIDAYLKSKNSPMAGQGANVMAVGQKYDLDPRLLVALAGSESRFGNVITRGQYDAMNDLYNGPGNMAPFPSWERAINGAGLSVFHAPDLSNTEKMYLDHYCTGPGCSDGLNNLNQFMREQGADPNALHYPKPPQK